MRFLPLLILLGWLPLTAAAQHLNTDTAWEALLARDFAMLETGLDALDTAARAGEVAYNDQRAIYSQFGTTHPEASEAILAWAAAYPKSRHPRTALMWTWHERMWSARGESVWRYFPQERAKADRDALAEMTSLATALFDEDPGFVPGADGVMQLTLHNVLPKRQFYYVSTAVKATRDLGVLERGLRGFYPEWGGSDAEMRMVCNVLAALVNRPEQHDAELCLIQAGTADRAGQALKDLSFTAMNKRWDDFDPYRQFEYALRILEDVELAKRAYDAMDQKFVGRVGHLSGIYIPGDDRLTWITAARDELERALERDPHNVLDLLEMSRVMAQWEWAEGQARDDRIVARLAEEGIDLLNPDRRLTVVEEARAEAVYREISEDQPAPYRVVRAREVEIVNALAAHGVQHPEFWDRRYHLLPYFDAASIQKRIEAAKNAIYFSNGRYRYVEKFASYVVVDFETMRSNAENWDRPDFDLEGLDFDPEPLRGAYACAAVHAARLISEGCSNGHFPERFCSRNYQQPAASRTFLTRNQGICPAMRDAPFEDLWITEPVGLDDLQPVPPLGDR